MDYRDPPSPHRVPEGAFLNHKGPQLDPSGIFPFRKGIKTGEYKCCGSRTFLLSFEVIFVQGDALKKVLG